MFCGLLLLYMYLVLCFFFFFQAEDGIRDLVRSRGLGDVYKRQVQRPVWHSFSPSRGVRQDAVLCHRERSVAIS